ncbi:hypothetical protein [Clostridium sp.]|uniref:hypothetical protein n=1 Tax=Clostridium sp. TaxID=1506 RepID=UPI002FC7DFD7
MDNLIKCSLKNLNLINRYNLEFSVIKHKEDLFIELSKEDYKKFKEIQGEMKC